MEVFTIANNNNKQDVLRNEQINVPEMMLIGPNGEKMGIRKLADALTMANYAGLDLVLMSPNSDPAVAKIMDYNKFYYEKQKKLKEQQKKQRENNKNLKEYQLSVDIDIGDFNTRKRKETMKDEFKFIIFVATQVHCLPSGHFVLPCAPP